MEVAVKIPTTIKERAELGDALVRIPATWEEYLDIVEDCEFPTEYDNNEIILMSIASDPHETIVANIITRLNLAVDDQMDMSVKGSKRHIFIPEYTKDYAPDVHVVKGQPITHTLRKGLTANLNPWLVVEVLSPSTYKRDTKEKLPRYKKIPSLQHIIYIEQEYPFVTVYNRVRDSDVWENIDYDKMKDYFLVAGKKIYLKDIYKKIIFKEAG
ncbi:MAG TPA: Uma2 family endonuclease [Bacteroidetes bacterium]|nr:Uma2 family endonuclease [Bacteroidota bacterium]